MRLYVRLCASVQVKDSGSLGYMYAAEIHAFAFEHLLYWFTPPTGECLGWFMVVGC
jgi:hypothetical protein